MLADFVISPCRHDDAALLTPDNRRVFLYRQAGYERLLDQMIEETGEPLIHAQYRQHIVDVYRFDSCLYYVRRHPSSIVALLDWHTPVVGEPIQATLSPSLRTTRPWQWEHGTDTAGWTQVADGSPQYVPTAADLGARLRAHVEYLDRGGQWVQVRTESSNPVVAPGTGPPQPRVPLPRLPPGRARFFLHVIPADVSDLPAHRQRWHYDNLDFSFNEARVPHGTRAIAVRTLPDYEIARLRTGQSTSEGLLWEAEVRFAE